MKSDQEMAALFGAEAPESLVTPLAIAEMCNVNLDPQGYHLPMFPVPEGYTAESFLRQLCEAGLRERYGDRADDPEIRQRLDYELGVIQDGIRQLFPHRVGLDAPPKKDIWWNVRGRAPARWWRIAPASRGWTRWRIT
jgi:DNA polymerase-3 subunit alpha